MSVTAPFHETEGETVPLAERWSRLLGGGWIFLLRITLVLVFGLLRPAQFGSTYNLSMLAVNAAIPLVLSVGQTFVIIAAGIDLSVGAVLVFASITSAQVMLHRSGAAGGTYGTTQGGWGVVAAGLIVALLSSAVWGALNGILVAVTAGHGPLQPSAFDQSLTPPRPFPRTREARLALNRIPSFVGLTGERDHSISLSETQLERRNQCRTP